MFPLSGFPIAMESVAQPIQATASVGIIPALNEPIRPTNTTISPVSFQIDRSHPVKVKSTRQEKIGLCPPAGDEKACTNRSHPVKVKSTRQEKIGLCPPAGDEKACTTYTKCSNDFDCKDVEKCCANACGSVCVDPTKATNCVHFVVAVKKLPEQKLKNGYIPKCDDNGKTLFSHVKPLVMTKFAGGQDFKGSTIDIFGPYHSIIADIDLELFAII
ncbi:unnamed protein product [Strongylus vulgaris]|uniref:WAP domain-containing protein n=1 Tax=Strongylus vulgaris TaxID=40348 RepID=A0A3P7LLX7_STRVU|nr:unnamed protein product [Strongylus vulgaris]